VAMPLVAVNQKLRREPWRRQRRTPEGPAAAAPIEGSVGAAAQRIQRDSAPHCSWSSSALCWAEESGTRRQERTGWAAASRNQIRAQAGSSPGGWRSMPTELMEKGAGMAAYAEDSQTRPRSGATQGGSGTGSTPPPNNPLGTPRRIPGEPHDVTNAPED
jgi:hypothetical protein